MSVDLVHDPDCTTYIPLSEPVLLSLTKTLSPTESEIPSTTVVPTKAISVVVATLHGIFNEAPFICEYVPNLVIDIFYLLFE